LLIVGSRIVTAEVFALTTNADTEAAARTPSPAARSAPRVAFVDPFTPLPATSTGT
jgi:hypothetical protein